MDYEPIERLDRRPSRNLLHEFDTYNYTIILRVFKLEELTKFTTDGGMPPSWDSFDQNTVTIAATGGTYNFPNRWGDPAQLSDAFIENLTMKYSLGVKGLKSPPSDLSYTLTIREPNGINLLTTLLTAFNSVNNFTQDKVLSSTAQVPILLSIYFNSNSTEGSANYNDQNPEKYRNLPKVTRHIPIQFIDVSFNITSTGTQYTINGAPFAAAALLTDSQAVLYDKITEIRGRTIGEYLQDLVNQMNKTQEELTKDESSEEPTDVLEYAVKAVGEKAQLFFNSTLSATIADGANIADSKMQSPEDLVDLFATDQPEESTSNSTGGGNSDNSGGGTGTAPPTPAVDGPAKISGAVAKERRKGLLTAMDKYGITDPAERAQFFAQVSHESGNFLYYKELATGKDYDITVNPRKAKDLGNDQPGDGPKYKGRGAIQVTGKNNYRECGSYINKDLVAEPALLERSDFGSESAIWYWVKRVRPQMAKRVNSKSYIKSGKPRTPIDFTNTCLVTHIVNGGFNGLQDRLIKFEQAKKDPDVTKGKAVTSTGAIPDLQQGAGASGNNNPTAVAQQQSTSSPKPAAQDSDAKTAARRRKKEQAAILKGANSSDVNSKVKTIKLEKEMTFPFVVELLALNSTYCLNAIKDADIKGLPAFIPYIKVYPTIEFEGYVPQYNVIKKRITYNIVGIEWAAPANGQTKDSEEEIANQIKDATIRGYNYLFTGKNIDILNLDLTFNQLFFTANAAYQEGTQATASSTGSSVDEGKERPQAAGEAAKKTSSSSGAMTSSRNTLPDKEGSSKGVPKDYNETESRFKSLMPGVWSGAPDLIDLNMEIIGDPELIPVTESALTSAEFEYQYTRWEQERSKEPGERSNDPTGFSTVYFLLTIGNPDPVQRSSAMIAGYYQFHEITANFKESGAFTMNIRGAKDPRLTVSTPEAKNAGADMDSSREQNKEAAYNAATSTNSTNSEATATTNQLLAQGGDIIDSALSELGQFDPTNLLQFEKTGLSSAAGGVANSLINTTLSTKIATSSAAVIAKTVGSAPGYPSVDDNTIQDNVLPLRLSSPSVSKDLVMFVNVDPNPTKDVTRPPTNKIFDLIRKGNDEAALLDSFNGQLSLSPDLLNQNKNLLGSAISAGINAIGSLSGLSNITAGLGNPLLRDVPNLLGGNGKSLAATGNFQSIANNAASLLGSVAVSSASAAISRTASSLSTTKLPGLPGLTTDSSAGLLQSVQFAAEEQLAKSAGIENIIDSAPNAVSINGADLTSQMNTTISPDQLKLEAKAVFNKITNISKGLPPIDPGPMSAVSSPKIPIRVVGGPTNLSGSSSSSALITNATNTLNNYAASQIEQVINNQVSSALTSVSNGVSRTSIAVPTSDVDLTQLSGNALAAVLSAKPVSNKNVPAAISSITALNSAQASRAASAAVSSITSLPNNIIIGGISVDINSIATAQGLSLNSLTNLTSVRRV